MRLRLSRRVVLTVAGLLVVAAARDAAGQQLGRSTSSARSSSTLRQGYQSGAGGQRLPFSTGTGRGGQQAGFGSRAGTGVGMTNGAGAVGQGAVGDGPLSAGLAQAANERFQEGGFVGRDAQDVRNSFDSQSGGRGTGGMLDNMIENLNEMRDSRRRWREQNAAAPPVRVRLQPAFDLPALPAGQASADVHARLLLAMEARGIAGSEVQIAGRTAVLRGVVANERDRALVERLARLEPGVSQVENLVTIQGPPAPPLPLP